MIYYQCSNSVGYYHSQDPGRSPSQAHFCHSRASNGNLSVPEIGLALGAEGSNAFLEVERRGRKRAGKSLERSLHLLTLRRIDERFGEFDGHWSAFEETRRIVLRLR